MNTTLIIPHGVAARNFLLGRLAANLATQGSLTVIHPLGDALREVLPPALVPGVAWVDSPPFSEGAWGYLLRRTFLLGHMRVCNTVGMRWVLAQYHGMINGRWDKQAVAERAAWWLSKLARDHHQLRRWTTHYSRLQSRRDAARRYLEIFRRRRPDVIFCADQRPPEMAAVVAAGRACGMPVGTFIFSWDNLSSKGRMPCEFDFYCVWSDLMKAELLQFYPFIDPATVYVTGTPQFEPYFDPALALSRAEFCANVGADPTRPLICYAGEDVITAPENPAHLQMICDLARQGQIAGRPQILVRPAPADDGRRWERVKADNPDIIWSPPRWRRQAGAGWERAIPTLDDIRLLSNLVRHAACCVNMVSTMTLDFAIGGKPSVNIAFDVNDPPPHGVPVWEKLFQYEHYRPVVALGAAHIARSPQELADKINLALAQPDANATARREFVRLQTNDTLQSASDNILLALQRIVATAYKQFQGKSE
jgi:hypothetical protein